MVNRGQINKDQVDEGGSNVQTFYKNNNKLQETKE